MPGGARWDRKVKTKLEKYYVCRYLYTSIYTYAAPESGHWHSPCPLAIWGPWTIPLPPQNAANCPAGRSRRDLAVAEPNQQPTRACRRVGVWR
jgi:hypothetical protein